MKTIYYSVSSGIQLIMAYFIKKLWHPDEKFVILMNEISQEMRKERFDFTALHNIFDEIVWEKDLTIDEKNTFSQRFHPTDCFYLSSFGQPFACRLLHEFPDSGEKILSYEGIDFYWITRFSIHFSYLDLCNKVDKILVLDKEMFAETKYLEKVTEIPIREWLVSNNAFINVCRELNKIFKYSSNEEFNMPSIVYFDRSSYLYIGADRELSLINCLTSCLKDTDYAIKCHPKDAFGNKFHNIKANVLSNGSIPWELIRLNQLVNGKISNNFTYIGYVSSALYHDSSFWGIEGYTVIVIEKVANKYVGQLRDDFDSDIIFDVYKRFAEKYKNVKVMQVNSFYEMEKIIKGEIAINKEPQWSVIQNNTYCYYKKTQNLELGITRELLVRQNTDKINYRCIGNKNIISVTKHFISEIPQFVHNEEQYDVTVICEHYLLSQTNEPIIFGYGIYFEYTFYRDLWEKLQKAEEIYIWGITESAEPAYQTIAKNDLLPKLKGFIDSFKYGMHKNYPISKFNELEKQKGRVIVICAILAKMEIEKLLIARGFKKEEDYYYGN